MGEHNGLTLGTQFLALVPSTDQRVHGIAQNSRAAKILLNRFTASTGERICPAVLIVRRDAPNHILRTSEPIVAFRNAIAFSHLLLARARNQGIRWTDHFDFHPTGVSRQGSELITYSPAVIGGGIDLRKYRAMAADYLGVHEERLRIDDYLYLSLGKAWHHRFISPGTDDRFTRALFRSLEVAYEAFSVRHKNYGSLHEYGLSTALLVSAIETLAAPAEGDVRKKHALALLSRYSWETPTLRYRRYRVFIEKQNKQKVFRWVNLIQRVYDRLYRARSKFLHGDRVSRRLLVPFESNPDLSLLRLSGAVYRTALGAYLETRFQRKDRAGELRWMLYGSWILGDYEKDLAQAFGIREE